MPHWYFDEEDRTLTFSESGAAKVRCNVTIAGSTKGHRWQWRGNKQAVTVDRLGTQTVKDFGEERQWDALRTPFLEADEYTGWECASIASHLIDGQAAYRFAFGDDDEYFAYLVITQTERIG